jgi:hypothetical protein
MRSVDREVQAKDETAMGHLQLFDLLTFARLLLRHSSLVECPYVTTGVTVNFTRCLVLSKDYHQIKNQYIHVLMYLNSLFF